MQNLSKKGNNVERWEQKQRNCGKKYDLHYLYTVLPLGEISFSYPSGKTVLARFWE